MNWQAPNTSEKLKIKKMKRSYTWTPVIIIMLPLLAVFITFFLEMEIKYKITLAIVLIFSAIALQATFIIRLKCPRCSAKATIPKGFCRRCGLKFD